MEFVPMTSAQFTKTNFPLGMVRNVATTKNQSHHKQSEESGPNLQKIQQNNFASHFSWGNATDYKGMSMTKTAFAK